MPKTYNNKQWQVPTATPRHLPAAAQLIDFAQQLGIDGMADAELLWIAGEYELEMKNISTLADMRGTLQRKHG